MHLAADVHAARRLVEQPHGRLLVQQAAERDLLLIAARQRPHRLDRRARLHLESIEPALALCPLRSTVDDAMLAHRGVPRAGQVVGQRHLQGQTLALAVLAEVPEPCLEAPPGGLRLDGDRATVDGEPAADRPFLEPHQPAQQLGAARAHEARDAEDLTSPHLQRRLPDTALDRDTLGLQAHGVARGLPSHRKQLRDVASDHVTDDLRVGQGVRGPCPDRPAIAQDGEVVGDGPDLLQEVADVDDGDALAAKPADEGEETLDVLARQAARRLVHQHHACVGGDGPTDLHHLPGRNRQTGHAAVRMQLGVVERLEHARRFGPGGDAVVATRPPWLAAEEDVLRDGQVITERQLLMDERHSRQPGLERPIRLVGRPAHRHRAGVGPKAAGDDVHEGALARAVLADEGVDPPGPDLQRDAVERPGRAEVLPDVGQRQHVNNSEFRIQNEDGGATGHGRYWLNGGRNSAFEASVSRLSGVTIVTPVSTRGWMASPLRCATIVLTP